MTSTATSPNATSRPADGRGLSTANVQRAVAALADGGMVVVIDDADRENEGDLVVAAEKVTPEQMAFVVRHSTGIVCAPMPAERADELRLPQMVTDNTDAHGTAFTVTVDAIGTGTGVSASDRAATFRALADPPPGPATCAGPVTSSRCAPARAGYWSVRATPRRRSTCCAWPDSPASA